MTDPFDFSDLDALNDPTGPWGVGRAAARNGLTAVAADDAADDSVDVDDDPTEAERRALADQHASTAQNAQNAQNPGPADEGPPVLPDELWDARPALALIRQAARHRGAGPDAVLAALLTHLSVRTPPSYDLPPLVGAPGSLNFAAAIIAVSGGGKGAAMRTGDDLLPPLGDRYGAGPLGTGPGMLDGFFRRHGDGEHTQCRDGWLYVADEGQVLEKLAEGQGSTTLETLRAGWSGERLGTATVSAPWRVLPAGRYRMCWLLGLQPAIARPLLADTAGGTPQRFLFVGALDPAAPLDRPADPGGLAWEPPTPTRRNRITVAGPVRDEIVARRHGVLTGRRTPGPYDAHRDQLRLKVAALLGLLDGRATVTVDDWALAGIVLDTSDAVREATLAAQRAAEGALEAGRNAKAATRASAEQAARRKVDNTVARVARVIEQAISQNGPMTRAPLRKAVAGRDREWFDDALDHALAEGWVAEGPDGKYA